MYKSDKNLGRIPICLKVQKLKKIEQEETDTVLFKEKMIIGKDVNSLKLIKRSNAF